MVPRLREMRPAARGGQDTGITQHRDHSTADPCIEEVRRYFLEGLKGRICVRTGVEHQRAAGGVSIAPPGMSR